MATDARTAGLPLRAGRTSLVRRALALADAHPVWAVFVLALGVRVVSVAAIAIAHTQQTMAPDATRYAWMAAQAAAGQTAGWDAYLHDLYHQVLGVLGPITVIYSIFGAHEWLGQLWVALLGAATAAFALIVGLEVLPRRWALAVGAIVALLPSQIIWSSLVLKDAAVWFSLSGLAVTVALAGRSRGLRLLLLGLLAAGLLMLLGYLRYQTLVVAAWALMLASVLGPRPQWPRRVGGAIALGVLVPWLAFNLGPAGITFAFNSYAPTYYRAKQSETARNPISAPLLPTQSGSAASSTAAPDEIPADVAHLPAGVSAMTIEPYPWRSGVSTSLSMARLADLVWYPIVLLAALGLASVRRRHLGVMAFPLLAGGTILILYALTEGSLGTAIRHRGEFEWVIALLAGFGLMRVAAWRSGRRSIAGAATAR